MPCLGPHKCSATLCQRATIVGVKYEAAVIPSRGQMDFAIRVDRAGGHLIADNACSVPVEQASGTFDVAIADNKIDRNAEDTRCPGHCLANVHAPIGSSCGLFATGAASAVVVASRKE